jgi:hypothetical protein
MGPALETPSSRATPHSRRSLPFRNPFVHDGTCLTMLGELVQAYDMSGGTCCESFAGASAVLMTMTGAGCSQPAREPRALPSGG